MTSRLVTAPWEVSAAAVLRQLDVTAEHGLSAAEVAMRQQEFGLNALQATPRRGLLSILFAQLKSIVVALLLAAGVLALIFGDLAEGLAIFAVVAINTALGFFTELRAVRSMEALSQFARADCCLIRGGKVANISADQVVPGDIAVFEAGDLVPADLRLLEAAKLAANESTLTGESLPVGKHTDVLPADTAIPVSYTHLRAHET